MMQTRTDKLRLYLHEFKFQNLFVEGLGWNFYRAEPIRIQIDDQEYVLEPIAEKAGFAVYGCSSNADGEIPNYTVRRKIERKAEKMVFEHLIIFVDANKTEQVWQWIKREVGKSAACREYSISITQTGEPLLQRLSNFIFTLEDEFEGIDITRVTAAVNKALDVERVTKRFYDRFKIELRAFQKFIGGIKNQNDLEWYASLMLNRMMFVYFIQKQGFLAGDVDYLRNRLHMMQNKYGTGKFQQFYRDFLVRLFHEGLGGPESNRGAELRGLLGRVPYLNGGLFEIHDLEKNYKISIPDEAFERIFDFFDSYRWHLDERLHRNDNEINPDVLGYIFEKYINQKQMGAYYTKDDITQYITCNTIIPFLFDAVKKKNPADFSSGGSIWRLLQDDPDRYIYATMGHGVAWTCHPDADPVELEEALKLPEEVAVGLHDVSQRSAWNQIAPAEYALPTETWREVVARRQRYQEVRDKLAAGKVTEVEDLITLNLDIGRFAKDVIIQSEGPELLWAFWRAIKNVTVLDPTCGSGAFLFAALNILEPLYASCLEGMHGFVCDSERSRRSYNSDTLSDFRAVLGQKNGHHNQRYFILKSIVLNNLYGVDIMDEAVEICKLRLFLKLVAQLKDYDQIEPLPDIDFNIRAGNTLVGFTSLEAVQKAMLVNVDGQSRLVSDKDLAALARIKEAAKNTGLAFDLFRDQQASQSNVMQEHKSVLRSRLDTLRNELDVYLAAEYGIDNSKTKSYHSWRSKHRPFHWFVEFYGIMLDGGFDCVIGNPPYLEIRDVDYQMFGYTCLDTETVHALCVERGISLIGSQGCMSMIVPLALPSTQRMKSVQRMVEIDGRNVWYANFAWRPAKLFDAVNRALTIFVVVPSANSQSCSTTYQKWTSDTREGLFERMAFVQIPRARQSFWAPKIGTNMERIILNRLTKRRTSVSNFIGKTKHRVFYRSSGGLYWKVFTDFAPTFSVNGRAESSSKEASFSVWRKSHVKPLIAVLSSNLFWWWYSISSNLRDMTTANISSFPIPESVFDDAEILELGRRYIKDIKKNSTPLVRMQKQTGKTVTQSFVINKSKHIIDEIDRILARHYRLTDKELDFIINYDIKYRMGLVT